MGGLVLVLVLGDVQTPRQDRHKAPDTCPPDRVSSSPCPYTHGVAVHPYLNGIAINRACLLDKAWEIVFFDLLATDIQIFQNLLICFHHVRWP